MSSPLKLWSFADVDRSGKVRWTAAELGYTVEEARLKLGEHRADPYLQVNPYGQIPAAEFDGKAMIESTAICIALAERHPDSGLIPAERERRDRFWELLNLAGSTLEMPVVMYYLAKLGVVDAAWGPLWKEPLEARLPVFAGQIPERDYLCGDFTLADIGAAYVLRIAVQAELLPLEGKLQDYLGRLAARPAAQQARFFDSL